MRLKHNSQQHHIFSLMSFPKSIKHTAFSTWVQDALCTMLKALFGAQIKVVPFCRKHTTFHSLQVTWCHNCSKTICLYLSHLWGHQVLLNTLWKCPWSLMPLICVVFHTKCFLCLLNIFSTDFPTTHLSLPSLSTHTVAMLSSIWHFALFGSTGLPVSMFFLGAIILFTLWLKCSTLD